MHVDTWLYFSPLLKLGPFLRPKSLSTDWLMISLPEITEPLACSAASSAGCLAVPSEDTLECELKRPGDMTSPQSFIERNVWATNKGLISDNIDRLFHAENRTQFPVRTDRSICTEDVRQTHSPAGGRVETARGCRRPRCPQGPAPPRRNAMKAQVVTMPQTLQDKDLGQRPGRRGGPGRAWRERGWCGLRPLSLPTSARPDAMFFLSSSGAHILWRLEQPGDTEGIFPGGLRWRKRGKWTAEPPSIFLQQCRLFSLRYFQLLF